MLTSDLHALTQLAVVCGMLGAAMFLALCSVLRVVVELVTSTGWWLDFEDRLFVRAQNLRRRDAQRGRSGLAALLLLVAFAWAAAACTAPIPHTDDHAVWLDRVKRSGW